MYLLPNQSILVLFEKKKSILALNHFRFFDFPNINYIHTRTLSLTQY